MVPALAADAHTGIKLQEHLRCSLAMDAIRCPHAAAVLAGVRGPQNVFILQPEKTGRCQ